MVAIVSLATVHLDDSRGIPGDWCNCVNVRVFQVVARPVYHSGCTFDHNFIPVVWEQKNRKQMSNHMHAILGNW